MFNGLEKGGMYNSRESKYMNLWVSNRIQS